MDKYVLLNHIGRGVDNSITKDLLMLRTGLSGRTVRRMIAELRHEYPIINLQDGDGYFIAERNAFIVAQQRLDMARATKLLERAKEYDKFIKDDQMKIKEDIQ